MKKPKMNKYDSIREVKRNIKLTPKQRKQERKDKTDFAYGVASVTPIGGAATRLIRAGKGLSRASRAFSSTPSKQLKNWDVVGKWDPSKTMTFKAPSKTKAVAMDLAKFNKPNMKKNNNKKRPEAPLQNGKELKPIMIKPNMGRIIKPMAKFPDLSGDGKVTKKDILMGKGVIDKPKMKKNKQKFFDDKGNEITMLDNVDKKGLSTQKSVERMFKAFKGAGGDIGGFRSTDVTTGNFSRLMKDKGFKRAAEKNPYYAGLKQAFRENRGFGKPNMINKPKMKKGKHSLGKDVVAEYAKKGISEKILNTFGTTSSDTVTVKSRNHRGINPRAGAALKLSGKKSGTVKGLYSSGKEIMTRGQGKKEKIAYAMGDRTYTQDNKKELAGKVMMYKSKPKMYNKPKYYGKKKK